MSRPLRVAMLTHSTLPRGGVVHAMSLSEALEDVGVQTVLHAPDSAGCGFFRKPRCKAVAFPVEPAPRDTADMVEQRIDDYVRWFRRPENRGFDLYHAHDGIGANALATLKEKGLIPAFVRTVHHIDDFADPRLVGRQARSILTADALMVVSALWRRNLIERFGREAEVGGNGVDTCRYSPHADGSEAELAQRLGLGTGPVFLSVGGIEARKNTTRILQAFVEIHRARPDARLVIAGGASLLDHHAYQAAFGRELTALGEGASAVSLLGPVADSDRHSIGWLPRSFSLRSRKVSVSACSRRWPAERRSWFRGSLPLSIISIRPTRSGAIRPIRHRSHPPCASRCDRTLQTVFARAARSSPHGLAGETSLSAICRSIAVCGSPSMPEMRFIVRWPDGRRESCYSPSLVIKDFLREGESYPVSDFLQRSREALQIASARVKAKYGHACSLALGQLARIEATATQFEGQDDARVACETFLDGGAR